MTVNQQSGESSAKLSAWGLPAVVAVALAVRAALMVPGFGRLDDPDNYLVLARSLAEGRGFSLNARPTAYRPPLYPIVLAPLVATLGDQLAWGLAALHLIMGAGTVGLTWLAARRWGMSPARALVASAIVACDPVLAAQARGVMTETLAALLIAAALAALAGTGRRAPWFGGIAFGLAALCRPSLLPAAGLTTAAALVMPPGPWPERLRRAAVLGLATSATLLSWAARNQRALGEPIVTTTHGGWTLALANNPVYYAEVLNGPPGAVWSGANQARWFAETGTPLARAGLSEPQADRRLRTQALRFIAGRPRDFLRASLARLARFWAVAPSGAVYSRATRLVTLAWTVPLWAALAFGLTARDAWRWPRVAAPAAILALTAVHSVYWTDMRMRAPIVPAIALVAAGAGRARKNGHAEEESRRKDP